MSCGCSNNINYPIGCGSSSCDDCSNVTCDRVIYSGPNLVCSGIDNNDNLCVALQKLDALICTISPVATTAKNGLYLASPSDVRMGGPLTEPTVIGTSIPYTLSITGLVTETVPDYLLTQTSIGIVRKASFATITSNILSNLTADNAITKVGNNFQLGGTLIQPTTIVTSNVNSLYLAGLVTNPSATYVVTIDPISGLLTKTNVSSLVSGILTADNGLTASGTNVQFGGTLIHPTLLNTSVSNTFSINGLVITSSPDYILTETNLGIVQMTTPALLGTAILNQITADNGLTKTGNNIQLGGPLVKNTLVDLATYSLTLKDSGAAPTGLSIIPGAAAPSNWTTSNVNIFDGKLSVIDNAKFSSNVGIGVDPDTNFVYGTRLNVYRNYATTSFPSTTMLGAKIDMQINQAVTGSNLNSSLNITSNYNRLSLYATPASGIITANGSFEAHYSATYSEFVYGAHSASTTSNNNISATASRGYFIYNSDIVVEKSLPGK